LLQVQQQLMAAALLVGEGQPTRQGNTTASKSRKRRWKKLRNLSCMVLTACLTPEMQQQQQEQMERRAVGLTPETSAAAAQQMTMGRCQALAGTHASTRASGGC
jgi:hypothetical protein